MKRQMDAEKSLHRKQNSRAGFTLVETLVAILILMMVTSIVAAGIPTARNAYENIVLASNAEVLLSTTISTLRNELGTAQNVDAPKKADGTAGSLITYYNKSIGATSRIGKSGDFTGVDDEGILFQRYSSGGLLNNTEGDITRLVTRAASDKHNNLYVTYDSVTYDEQKGIVTFSSVQVFQESRPTPLVERDSVSIRVISD